jgi:hypothetical protein
VRPSLFSQNRTTVVPRHQANAWLWNILEWHECFVVIKCLQSYPPIKPRGCHCASWASGKASSRWGIFTSHREQHGTVDCQWNKMKPAANICHVFFALTDPAIASVRTAAHTPAILGRDGAPTRPSWEPNPSKDHQGNCGGTGLSYFVCLSVHIFTCGYTHIHACMHAYITLHYITLHYFTLHYITSHHIHTYKHTSSTAQGGGRNFKNRKPIGEVGCWWLELCFLEGLQWLQWSPYHNCWM